MTFISTPLSSLDAWTRYFSGASIPVLGRTVAGLEALRTNQDDVAPRDISRVVLRDPLMTLNTLVWSGRLMRQRLKDRLSGEVETVEAALLMVGVRAFFAHFQLLDSCEARLADHPLARLGLMRVLARSVSASQYAGDWAAYRHDLDAQVIQEAALLHDTAEMLMWSFAPELSLKMQATRAGSATMRSADIQRAIIGITLDDLAVEIFRAWHLPALLLKLTDGSKANHPAVKNVMLAVNLARHSAVGWHDPAIEDDYREIAALLKTSARWVEARVRPNR